MNDFEMRDLFEQVQAMELRLKALEDKEACNCCKEEQLVYNILNKVMNMAKKETLKKPAAKKAAKVDGPSASEKALMAEKKAQVEFILAAKEAGDTRTDKEILADMAGE